MQLSKKFFEQPNFEYQHVERALPVLCEENDFIQSQLYNNSKKYSPRNNRILYYDCTNFFFEIECEDDFRKYNPTYHNSDFLMPGQAYPDKRSIPIINVYFDMSGSWNFRDTEKGREALKFLDNLQTRKKLKYKLYYFANNIYDNPDSARKETGTHAFPKIIEHIQATRADNVVIFTDDDFDDQTHNLDKLPYLKLKGGAWWLWRRGIRARRAFKHIQGSRPENTFQYSFTPQ